MLPGQMGSISHRKEDLLHVRKHSQDLGSIKGHLAPKLIFSTKSVQQQFHIYALVVEDLGELGANRFSRGGFPVKESQSKLWLLLNCAPSFYLLLLISQVLKGIISASAGGKLIA